MRRWVQGVSAVLQNAYLAFPWTHNLYQGPLKQLCTPGLNCYSCPAAVLSCPLGTLQYFIGALRPALRWGTYRLGFSVVGFLVAVGLFAGRFPCGWLCPFGFLQDGLYKIRSPKLPIPQFLSLLRYAILGVFVILLPLFLVGAMGYGETWYCRLLCPAGTLESGGLFFLMPGLREQVGWTFSVKIAILGLVLGWAVVSYRPYCRTACPLGAIYGIFNRWSLLGIEHDSSRCISCHSCADGCEVEIDPRRGSANPACLRCFGCATKRCPTGALSIRIGSARFRVSSCGPHSTPAS